MKHLETYRIFNGEQQIWQHFSGSLNCEMTFAIYLPDTAKNQKLPILYWLSGLTCTEQNFITKSGFQRYADEHNLIVVAPDTSPRGENVADDDAYDLGQGAGFYVNATQGEWASHYQMYDYIVKELPALMNAHFPTNGKQFIFGHSMGGHGALTIAFKNPNVYQSVSAFSPIVAPTQVAWGQKAFNAYLGDDKQAWADIGAIDNSFRGCFGCASPLRSPLNLAILPEKPTLRPKLSIAPKKKHSFYRGFNIFIETYV